MPPSFVNLLEGDDLPQIGGNNTGSITPTNPHTSYPPYPPQPNYHHQSYQPYYPPQPNLRNPLGGSSQNPRNYPPPYYPPPYNEAQYLYYHPYYPLPPPNSNYFSGDNNYTPSSTPIGSTVRLGNSEADMDSSTDEGGVAAKRRFKEKANNTVVDLVTKLKELSRINFDMSQKFKDFVKLTEEDRAHKMMMWEQKLRLHEDRIMMMDTSTMTPRQTAYIEHRRAEIMQRRSGDSSSTQ